MRIEIVQTLAINLLTFIDPCECQQNRLITIKLVKKIFPTTEKVKKPHAAVPLISGTRVGHIDQAVQFL